MLLSDKIKILRQLEGNLRGLNRPLSKSEVIRLVSEELGETISQAYLSQLENGKRPHMTEKTRELLSRFFKVHPGFFVSDPEGFDTNLTALEVSEERLDDWLREGATRFEEDSDLSAALRSLADHDATRDLLILVSELMRSPDTLLRLKLALQEPATKREKAMR